MNNQLSENQNVIEIYDNSKSQNVAYSFFISGCEFGFFVFIDRKYIKIPFNVEMNITNGNIKPKKEIYLDMAKNMADSYSSYSDGGIDIVTGQKQELRLFRLKEYFITHNVFTSIVYTIAVIVPKPFINITNHIADVIELKSLNIFNTNYYLHFYKSNDARKLVILETKIYFWWCIFHKDKDVDNNEFFSFYLWIFNNIKNINSPYFPGRKSILIQPYIKYFKMIDETHRLTDFFILRYGPKFLTEGELRERPIRIYDHINFNTCKNNIQRYILSVHTQIKNLSI